MELKDKDRQSFQLETGHHVKEIDIIQILDKNEPSAPDYLSSQDLESFLGSLPSDEVYRVKGLLRLKDKPEEEAKLFILNFAFGRSALTLVTRENVFTRLTVMGVDLRLHLDKFKAKFKTATVELIEKSD